MATVARVLKATTSNLSAMKRVLAIGANYSPGGVGAEDGSSSMALSKVRSNQGYEPRSDGPVARTSRHRFISAAVRIANADR
jgi:hypothetical protein